MATKSKASEWERLLYIDSLSRTKTFFILHDVLDSKKENEEISFYISLLNPRLNQWRGIVRSRWNLFRNIFRKQRYCITKHESFSPSKVTLSCFISSKQWMKVRRKVYYVCLKTQLNSIFRNHCQHFNVWWDSLGNFLVHESLSLLNMFCVLISTVFVAFNAARVRLSLAMFIVINKH